jgi:hypothetical protein
VVSVVVGEPGASGLETLLAVVLLGVRESLVEGLRDGGVEVLVCGLGRVGGTPDQRDSSEGE